MRDAVSIKIGHVVIATCVVSIFGNAIYIAMDASKTQFSGVTVHALAIGLLFFCIHINLNTISWARGPRGVSITRVDGTEVPCDVVPVGVMKGGIRAWMVVNRVPYPGDTVRVDILPPRTMIVVATVDE